MDICENKYPFFMFSFSGNNKISDKKKKYTIQMRMAMIMFVMGLAFGWAGFFVDPVGEISNSVLGMVGECFTLGGFMWGLVGYTNLRLVQMYKRIKHNDLSEDEIKAMMNFEDNNNNDV